MRWLFAFGTLKRGFPLHDQALAGAMYLGPFRTVRRFPRIVAGPRFAPMMLYQPGTGLQIEGELYEIDGRLAAIDALESVGKPGNFRRLVEVEPLQEGSCGWALVYMKAEGLAMPVHPGFLDVYKDHRFVRVTGCHAGRDPSRSA